MDYVREGSGMMRKERLIAGRVPKRLRKVACGLCVAALVMSGCGGEGGGKETEVTKPATPTAAPKESQEPTKMPEPTDVAGNPAETGGEETKDLILSGTADEILACFREKTFVYAKAMLAGDFSVCDDFSTELSTKLSERDMKNAWKQTVAGLGEPLAGNGEEGVDGIVPDTDATFLDASISGSKTGNIADFGGYVITSAQIPYQKKNVVVSITYGQTGVIEGIYMTYTLPAAEPEVTEEYVEHVVKVGKGEFPLEGILTLPNGVQKPPVVLLVHGSGQSDKDETIGAAGNAPFADIAHGLALQGIATLRYDKRYYEYPELAASTITIWDEVLDDVAEAVALLSETQEVDAGHIFVLGHSLGGMLAPYIVQENPQVAGMVSLAGSPRGLWEIVYDQNIALMQATELTEPERASLEEMLQQEYDRLVGLVADVRDGQLGEEDGRLSEVLFGVSGYYWASLAKIDVAAAAQDIPVPMLILQGEADFQVYPERDFAAWQTLLTGKENVTFHLFEGLNHLFMPSNGAMDLTEYDEEAHVSQDVIDMVADWIKEVSR